MIATVALIIATIALILGAFLFAVCRKLIEANKLAAEVLEEIARVLERNIIR